LTVLLTSFLATHAYAGLGKVMMSDDFNKRSLQQNVVGTVRDSLGNNMPGVTVQLKGTNRGTATDMDGKYSISVPANSTLVFSIMGYTKQEIALNGRSILDVVLNEDASSLEIGRASCRERVYI